MSSTERDYWKKSQNTNKTNNKFDIIISEYNKNVPFYKRYYKISDILIFLCIIFIIIFFTIILLT